MVFLRSPNRHTVLICSGGAEWWTYSRGAERGPGFTCRRKSAQSGWYSSWNPEMLQKRCLHRTLRNPLPVLEGGRGTTRHARLINIVLFTKKGWQERLQWLPRHLTAQHCWKTLCSDCTWSIFKCLKREFLHSYSVVSMPNAQQHDILYKDNYKKNVGNRDSHCTSKSLTSLRYLIWWLSNTKNFCVG